MDGHHQSTDGYESLLHDHDHGMERGDEDDNQLICVSDTNKGFTPTRPCVMRLLCCGLPIAMLSIVLGAPLACSMWRMLSKYLLHLTY